MESIPVLSELMQAGVVGICLALIVTLIYVIKLNINALMTFSGVLRDFTAVIEKHNERLDGWHRDGQFEGRRKADKAA